MLSLTLLMATIHTLGQLLFDMMLCLPYSITLFKWHLVCYITL